MSTAAITWGTVAEHTLLSTQLDSLADVTYSSAGSAIDLGATSPFSIAVEAKITGTASSTGPLNLYVLWSADNTDFSEQAANYQNGQQVEAIDLNGSTETKKVFSIDVRARYLKLIAYNDSGASLAANAGDIVATEASVDIT